MPTVTGLRGERHGRVTVDLDGAAWRTLPLEAVVRAGLAVGVELDRARALTLRRALRREAAFATAATTLRSRDLTRRVLDARLERRGIGSPERAETIDTLVRTGVVDDERFARGRAAALAARYRGDAAIRWDLERQGVPGDVAERVLAELEPERDRATRIARKHGRGPATGRLLAARGFGDDAIEHVAGGDFDTEPA